MAVTPPTRLTIDPPIDQWQVAPRNGRTTPIIATGHQPWLWHPGVLAKDIAADAFANKLNGNALHLVVDHDVVQMPGISVPSVEQQALLVRRYEISSTGSFPNAPVNILQPIDGKHAKEQLTSAGHACMPLIRPGLERLAAAYEKAGHGQPNLARQTTQVLDQLIEPYLHKPMAYSFSSGIVTERFVKRLLADPVRCVRCYNRSALAYPEARIRPLYLGRDVVEAPLWAQDKGSCTPVYIDLGDSRRPLLFTHSQDLDLTGNDALKYLRPRAISLSALMRSEHCDLFIHGKGGGVYDQVTDRWWHDWIGEALAPMAVVSADLYLPFEVPVSTRDELEQAVWFDHHLPFNVDRFTQADDDAEAALKREKKELLDHMNDDRDQRRRAKAFKRLHAINAQLQARHQAKLDQARQQAEHARIGVKNRHIASRRDWCFALYPPRLLEDLRSEIAGLL